MSELLDRLFELDTARRFAVYGVIAAVILGIYWYFFFSPGQIEIAEKRQVVEEKENEKATKTRMMARLPSLEILVFRQRPENLQEFYAEVPVEMVMRGNYRQVTSFVDAVGRLNRIVNLTNIAIRNPVLNPEGVLVDTSCTAVTFRFLSEEERARIAAQKAAEKKK